MGILEGFTLYASVIYNKAIATSNTEIVMNSVVILFICDVDELNFDILQTINANWTERASSHLIETPSDEDGENSKYEGTNPEETNPKKADQEETCSEKEHACEIEVAVAGQDVHPKEEHAREIEVAVAGHNQRLATDCVFSKEVVVVAVVFVVVVVVVMVVVLVNLSGENHKLKEEMKNLAQGFQVLDANMDAIMEHNEMVMQQNAKLLSLLEQIGCPVQIHCWLWAEPV